ncbi:uncharacterized protein Dwil_GK15666 [Drosophila willistoni]|uniref:Uncharacterized protein n=1 Tax=Drosophila willistoni TaxID=7260 RepID=B4MRZ1_DROWI|nr:uncharacterized protein Dwil_GK15666 [Drosophila willistoni]
MLALMYYKLLVILAFACFASAVLVLKRVEPWDENSMQPYLTNFPGRLEKYSYDEDADEDEDELSETAMKILTG